MTRILFILIIATFLSCGSSQMENSDLSKVQWTVIDKTFSYSIVKKGDQQLTASDTILFKGLGEIDNNGKIIHRLYLDTLIFKLEKSDTILLPQYQTLGKALTKNSLAYLKVDLTTISNSLGEQNSKITLYLSDNIDSVGATGFLEELKKKEFANSADFISKEKSAKELEKTLGDDFVSFLGRNPLLNSIELKVKSSFLNSKDFAKIVTLLKGDKRVKDITYSNIFEYIDKYKDKRIVFRLST